MNNENYKNAVGWCPLCKQGWIWIVKDIKTHKLFLQCQECQLEFDSPTKMIESKARREPCTMDWVVPTIDEVKEMQWDKYLLMVERELLFMQFIWMKNQWLETSLESLEGNTDLTWSSCGEEYQKLKHLLKTKKDKEVYEKVVNELIVKTIHSILEAIDDEDDFAGAYIYDLVVKNNNNKSLKENGVLRKSFQKHIETFGDY